MLTKQCCRCKRTLPLTAFTRLRTSPDGLRYDCKDCLAAYRARHREHQRAYMHQYARERVLQTPERVCRHCHVLFHPNPIAVRRGYAHFCSRVCFFADRKAQFDADFWNRMDRSAGPDGCWPWLGSKNPGGYGVFRRKPYIMAHRQAWIVTYGPIPHGLLVCHQCDQPACVNPAHLFLGTQRRNILDAVHKARWTQKLTAAQVQTIRALYGIRRGVDLAHEYGVSPRTIYDIWHGRSWKSVAK